MTRVSSDKSHGPQPRSTVQVISRAAAILRLLAQEPRGTSLTEVVRRTDLPKSTAYRILLSLQAEQIVESREGQYRLGQILRPNAIAELEPLRFRARPFMERLAARLHETVDLAMLVGDQILIVEQMRWVRELTAGSVVGALLPAATTASGLALLAASPAHEMSRAANPDEAGAEAFAEELREVRDRGLAIMTEGYHQGISGIATFAVDEDGRAFALGVPVPTVRFEDQAATVMKTLLDARPEFERMVLGDKLA